MKGKDLMGGKVSIIVPVYNAENTIDRCVASLCAQSYNNLEIILINDGSKDNSLRKLMQWQAIDSRIIVVSQENQGAACARNKGLDRATGEFISFVDADDEVAPLIYEKMVKASEQMDADIVSASILEKYDGGITEERKNDENWPVLSGTEAACAMLCYEGGIRTVVWDKLYRAEILEDIRFEKGYVFAEDTLLNYQAFMKCRRYYRISYVGYTYDHTESTVTKGAYRSTLLSNIYVAQTIKELCSRNDSLQKMEKAQLYDAVMYYCITITRQVFYNLMLKGHHNKEDAADYAYLRNWAKSLDKAFLRKNLSPKDYMQWLLYVYCPRGFLIAHKLNHMR